jgi:hypothetical protein
MKMNLNDYVIKFDKQFGSEICETAVRESEEYNYWQQHQYSNPNTGEEFAQNGDRELDISNSDFSVKPVMMYLIWDALKKYTTQLNMPWFGSWAGYSDLRMNRYKENQIMSMHCDHIHTLFEGERKGIPILTVLAGLNNDYEGGELYMPILGTTIKPMTNSLVLWSHSWHEDMAHSVKKVISGTRYMSQRFYTTI